MKFTKKILCFLLVAAMIFSVAGCKKSDNSSELSIEYIYEYEDAPADSVEQTGTEATQSVQTNQNANNTSSGKATTTSKKIKDAYEAQAKKYRGKTIRFATWQSAGEYGEDVIKAFEKKYGIKVEIEYAGQADYVKTVAASIAANKAPDVYYCITTFPNGLECLQPIDAAELNMDDPIWDTTILENSKVNGKSYLVNTVGTIFDGTNCLFYNKAIFENTGIKSPQEYVDEGTWTLDNFEKCMKELKAASSDIKAAYININTFLNAMGCNFWQWDNGKMKNGAANEKFVQLCRRYSQWYKDGLITEPGKQEDTSYFKTGNCGMALCESFGLKKVGYWRDFTPSDDIGFTYIPDYDANTKAYSPSFYSAYGICRGAENPGAAGVFLRYYLDVNNWDTTGQFISEEAESFYYKVTTAPNKVYYFVGSDGVAGCTTYSKIVLAMRGDPNQLVAELASLNNTIDMDVANINKMLAKY